MLQIEQVSKQFAADPHVLARMLAATGGNQSEAARRLGTSRVTLVDKLKKYGLTTRKND